MFHMILFLRTSKSEESGYDSDTRRSLEALSGRKGEEGKETEEEEVTAVDRTICRARFGV